MQSLIFESGLRPHMFENFVGFEQPWKSRKTHISCLSWNFVHALAANSFWCFRNIPDKLESRLLKMGRRAFYTAMWLALCSVSWCFYDGTRLVEAIEWYHVNFEWEDGGRHYIAHFLFRLGGEHRNVGTKFFLWLDKHMTWCYRNFGNRCFWVV